MDKQQIKEAAAKASEDYMENTLIMSGPRGSYRKGFIAGAEWRINSVWHTLPKDLPKKENTLILLELKFEGRLVYLPVEWVNDGEGVPSQATRWAYLDDLLPERKEETK